MKQKSLPLGAKPTESLTDDVAGELELGRVVNRER